MGEEHQEHQQGGDPLRGVEVVVDDLHHVAAIVERLQDQGVGPGHEGGGDGVGVLRAEAHGGEHHVPAAGLPLEVVGHQLGREDLRFKEVSGLVIGVDQGLERIEQGSFQPVVTGGRGNLTPRLRLPFRRPEGLPGVDPHLLVPFGPEEQEREWGIPLYEAELREGVQPLLQEGVVFGVFLAVELLARGQEGIVVVEVPEVAVELDAVA